MDSSFMTYHLYLRLQWWWFVVKHRLDDNSSLFDDNSSLFDDISSWWIVRKCTQRLYRRRFESHLGLGTFTDVNLYLCYPLFFHSLFMLKPQPYPHPHGRYLETKKSFFLWPNISDVFHIGRCIPRVSWIYLIINFANSVSLSGGRTSHRWFPRSRVLPLGHGDFWKFDEVTPIYIGNPLSKLRKLGEEQVRNPPGARNFSSAQLSPMATHATCNPCFLF